jgi:hypothetical protein
MARIIRLTESDLARIVKRIINENTADEEGFCIDFKGNRIACKGNDTDRYGDPDSCIDNNYKEIPCKDDGTDRYAKLQTYQEVTVTAKTGIEIQLKKPMDGYLMIKYVPKTGEILGNGDRKHVLSKIQKGQTEEQVRSWLKRNHIKAYL